MRLSCNGCRVLRKGCSEDCTIRPSLQWLKSPEAQANATVFLAKFYGRSGLLNLIDAGPDHLRPAIFRSLLYEACGRVLNPVYGSVGLLSTSSWQQCQAAVQAVLRGEPIARTSSDTFNSPDAASSCSFVPLIKSCDIRHVRHRCRNLASVNGLRRVYNARNMFKRTRVQQQAQLLNFSQPAAAGVYSVIDKTSLLRSSSLVDGMSVIEEYYCKKNESASVIETTAEGYSNVSQADSDQGGVEHLELELKL